MSGQPLKKASLSIKSRNKEKLIRIALVLALIIRLLPVLFSPTVIQNSSKTDNLYQQIIEKNFFSFLPNNEAGLLSGIVLGTKKSLPSRLFEQMKQTGTLHIAVASGMNIALLAGPALAILTIFFKRKIALVCLILLIWFYALITGFDLPVIRAALMASLLYLAQEFGRKADNVRILILTGYVMVFLSPAIISNLSFQLSFGSMLGLVFLQPILKKGRGVLKSENLSSTLACQLATLPIIMMNFGEYNLISILINFLVLWSIPYLFGIGLLVALFSLVSKSLAQLLAYLCYPLLAYFTAIIKFFFQIKFFQLWVPKWGRGLAAAYYLFLYWWVKRNYQPETK